jgi:hypothetical protein
MKKAFFVLLVGVLVSCMTFGRGYPPTAENPYRPLSGIPNANVIGTVSANFTAPVQILGEIMADNQQKADNFVSMVNGPAYNALLEAAKQEYSGNIDVVDITWAFIQRLNNPVRFQYSASGRVVTLDGANRRSTATGVEGALTRAAGETLKNVPKKSRIAIVFITAQDRSTTDYIAGELEFIWVNEGYIITDRSQLDRLRREQNFQLSGEVDDATAVSIGKFAGADIIVTGRVDGEGNLQRLRLRALDTQTAQVVGVASERL